MRSIVLFQNPLLITDVISYGQQGLLPLKFCRSSSNELAYGSQYRFHQNNKLKKDINVRDSDKSVIWPSGVKGRAHIYVQLK